MHKYSIILHVTRDFVGLKGHLGLPWEDDQHAVIDEFLRMVAGCALGTDVYHWIFRKRST